MRWLLTYADMITLLMLFFIILYSLSSLNRAKYTEMAQAFNSVFNGGNFTIFDTRSARGGRCAPGSLRRPEGAEQAERQARGQGRAVRAEDTRRFPPCRTSSKRARSR